ncbi:hypothetical protein V6N13_068902 [Hibiscus sabdariffa]|uniref:Clp R domain-containing protein n=1 Tax=Hibiscus sabdariffa TaxID=183260 RepID=A0ABR2QNY4_9ROSI
MMARVVAQSALLTGHGLSDRVEKPKMSVRMVYGFRTPLLRMRSDSICLDNKMVRFGQDSRLPITITSSSRPGCLAKEARFTEEAIEAIMLARDESRRLGHNHIGTEQILLGLIGEGTGITAKVVESMGIKLKDAREQVGKICPRGRGCFAVGFPFTSLATSALLHSLEHARKRGHNLIGPEHLLLGLLRQRVARCVLKDLDADSSNIYAQVISILDQGNKISIVTERSIGNTTPEPVGYGTNLTKLLDKYDSASAMTSLPVKSPSIDETILILKHLKEHYEIRHKLRYTDEALIAAAELSHQYISDRPLPDKAIDLIDEAGARVCARYAQFLEETRELRREYGKIIRSLNEEIRRSDYYGHESWKYWKPDIELRLEFSIFDEMNKAEKVVTEVDIQDVVSSWTGIPVEKVITDESDRLVKMEETLHERVIGQDEAVKAVSRACVRARNPNGPIASFFFCGPTGVGKSELARALAANYFGSEEAVIRIDEDEIEGDDVVSRFIGSHPEYTKEGGHLTEPVRRRPYTVVIFDEICIDHDVFNMILEILEYGRLVDGEGRIVDFRNTILIATCYIKSSGLQEIGYDLDEGCSYNRMKRIAVEELELFEPIAKRFDEMIVFMQLTKSEAKEIADVKLKEAFDRLKAKEIQLGVTERFRETVAEQGCDPMYGAWPLCRAIRHLEDSVAEKMVAGEIKEGDSVTVDADSDGNAVILNGCSLAL